MKSQIDALPCVIQSSSIFLIVYNVTPILFRHMFSLRIPAYPSESWLEQVKEHSFALRLFRHWCIFGILIWTSSKEKTSHMKCKFDIFHCIHRRFELNKWMWTFRIYWRHFRRVSLFSSEQEQTSSNVVHMVRDASSSKSWFISVAPPKIWEMCQILVWQI